MVKSEIAGGLAEISAGKAGYTIERSEGTDAASFADATAIGLQTSSAICTSIEIGDGVTSGDGIECTFSNSNVGGSIELEYDNGQFTCKANSMTADSALLPKGCE
ncbi:pilin [Psychromonas sp. 14N.309.X.WAT.B.A12]|nr:pilin [Psychromonas sp. 14N.309.X.WAT.B.A12]